MRPCIGIPLCLDDRGRWRPGRDYVYADRAYSAALEAADATPMHLATPTSLVPEKSRAIVQRLDGLMIPGGDDFPPSDPGAYPADTFDLTSAQQIAFDRSLLTETLAAGKPLLGICYGMQLLALDAGGALYPHLPTDLEGALEHGGGDRPTTRHPIDIARESRLARIVGGSGATVNSRHHQGVRDAGNLAVAARSSDGLIEAVEAADPAGADFVVGVQWHPETLDGAAGSGLIRAFVEAARSGAAQR